MVPVKVALPLSRIPSGHPVTQMAINRTTQPLPGTMFALHRALIIDLQCHSTKVEVDMEVDITAEIIEAPGAALTLLMLKVVSLKTIIHPTNT
jgi:hypothetical protein